MNIDEVHAFGRTMSIGQWAEDPMCQVAPATVKSRLEKGWPAERAISELHSSVRRVEGDDRKYKGVYYRPERMVWFAKIMNKGKSRRLGTYDNQEDAARAYNRALRELNNPDRRQYNDVDPQF